MAKSDLYLLKEALAKGDLERATQLADKIDKAGKTAKTKAKTPEKAPSRPTKASARKVAVSVQEKPKRATKSTSGPRTKKRHDIDASQLEESDYLAPSRRSGDDYYAGRSFIGPDGKEHTYARRVSMAGTKFVNKFNPDEYEKLSGRHAKLDSKIKKLRAVPRPGQRGAERDVSKKVKVQCTVCRDAVEVYPWEAETVDGESNFRCSKKNCVRAR